MYDASYSRPVRVLHSGDLHIDSPPRGLEQYEGAPSSEVVNPTRAALVRLVDYAVANDVALVLIAGDVYDGDWRDYNTGLFFHRQLVRLQDAGVRVVMVHGNHDAASVISRALSLPENTTVLSHREPEQVVFEDIGLTVTGQSFATPAVTHDLTQQFPDPVSGLVNFALLHTSADGRPGHEPYAPCKPAELVLRGFDYWALGHVHGREILSEDPWITFCGNLQGRHVRERGAKGFFMVDVTDGAVEAVTSVDVDVLRWDVLSVDVSDAITIDDVAEAVAARAADATAAADGRPVATRVVLSGTSQAHVTAAGDHDKLRAYICAAAAEACGDAIWIEKVQLKTMAPRRVVPLTNQGERSDVFALFGAAPTENDMTALASAIAPLRQKLPMELRRDETFEIGSEEHIAALIPEIDAFLRDELHGSGDES